MGSPGAQTRRPTSDGMYLPADLGQPTPDSLSNCHPSSITIIPKSFAAAPRRSVFIRPMKSANISSNLREWKINSNDLLNRGALKINVRIDSKFHMQRAILALSEQFDSADYYQSEFFICNDRDVTRHVLCGRKYLKNTRSSTFCSKDASADMYVYTLYIHIAHVPR